MTVVVPSPITFVVPELEPPVEFVVSVKGAYVIEIKEVRGINWGKATLTVS